MVTAVDKMAMTNYVMHSIYATYIFKCVGFGFFGIFQLNEFLSIVFSVWIFQLTISLIWLTYFQYGPLEWLWRSLSYFKKQHFLLPVEANQ